MPYPDFLEARRAKIAEVIRKGFETIGAGPTDASVASSQDAAMGDIYLDPTRPFSNDLAIRRILRRLNGDVLWYEQHMDRKALELLTEELPLDQVDRIRLLSGPANVSARVKRGFDRFETEVSARGVEVEWRILSADRARDIHVRVISDDDETFEVPPLNSVLKGTVDSIRNSDMPLDFFEDAWTDATAVKIQDFQAVS